MVLTNFSFCLVKILLVREIVRYKVNKRNNGLNRSRNNGRPREIIKSGGYSPHVSWFACFQCLALFCSIWKYLIRICLIDIDF